MSSNSRKSRWARVKDTHKYAKALEAAALRRDAFDRLHPFADLNYPRRQGVTTEKRRAIIAAVSRRLEYS